MARIVLSAFEEYQKERVSFVQTIAELARQPKNIETLQGSGVLKLLRPLLLDNVSSIQQSAALALARLASYSVEIAEEIVENQVLTQLIDSLSRQNRFYKKAASYVLKSVAQHSEHLAQCVINAGALEALINCLEEFDPNVKEGAAFALSAIAKHANPSLAEEIAKAGAIEHLSVCIQDPETNLRKVATMALGEIAKHNNELASQVATHPGTLVALSKCIQDRDIELRQNVCICLANISKHNEETSLLVFNAGIVPAVFTYCLKEERPGLQKYAVQCIKEIAGQSRELASKVVETGKEKETSKVEETSKKEENTGVLGAIVKYLNSPKILGSAKLPAVMALGFIAGYDESLAMEVIDTNAHKALIGLLNTSKQEHLKAATCWSLGQIGKHSSKIGTLLAEEHALESLLNAFNSGLPDGDLQRKARRALKNLIKQSGDLLTLAPLMKSAPPKILTYLCNRFTEILSSTPALKRQFAEIGLLEAVQDIKPEAGSKLDISKKNVNELFPEDVVNYFTKNLLNNLIEQEDQYQTH